PGSRGGGVRGEGLAGAGAADGQSGPRATRADGAHPGGGRDDEAGPGARGAPLPQAHVPDPRAREARACLARRFRARRHHLQDPRARRRTLGHRGLTAVRRRRAYSEPPTMFIQTEATGDPASLKFLPGRQVLPRGSLSIRDRDQAARSPLATRLFDVDGVAALSFGPDYITVTKESGD